MISWGKANRNGLRFSTTKTHCVHFCRLRTEHGHPRLTLQDQILEYKSETKFLGMTIDSKLYWGAHINDISLKCKKVLNLLRSISSITWGADKETLLNIHRTMILSRMDYGCVVYGSARKSRLKKLNSIHCMGLRIALGAYRTSPLKSLCCEAGIPPLEYRQQQFLVSYCSNIWAQPEHPNYKIIFDQNLYSPYQNRSTITRPVSVRFHELLNAMGESLPSVYNLRPTEIPPWKLILPKFHLECTMFKKNDCNRLLLLTQFYTIVNSYEGQKLYTDGSKLDQGVGSAFSDGINVHSWSLPKSASIYTAELYAIWMALRYVEMNSFSVTLICSDSLSALKALSDYSSSDPLIQSILELSHHLQIHGKQVIFVWTPSHMGINGNELADDRAKFAAEFDPPENIPIRNTDLKIHLKQSVMERWQEEWNATDAKLKEIKQEVNKWKSTTSLTRREQSVISRLRIGHTNLTSSYLLTGNQSPVCNNCITSQQIV